MKIHTYFFISAVALTLAACKAQTFDERLAGKTGAEREKEAYYACIERSDNAIPGGHSREYHGHHGRMRKLCDSMHEANTTSKE